MWGRATGGRQAFTVVDERQRAHFAGQTVAQIRRFAWPGKGSDQSERIACRVKEIFFSRGQQSLGGEIGKEEACDDNQVRGVLSGQAVDEFLAVAG